MCGLFGYLSVKKPTFDVNKLMRAMGTAGEVRGKHATGYAYGTEVHKLPVPASELEYSIPFGTRAAIGHTRHTTQGSELKNYNNHPFQGRDYSFAHNGILDNDDEVKYSFGLPDTEIETDTYAAVQLLDHFIDSGSSYEDAILKMSEQVSGMFAFSILHADGTLHIVRNDSDMYMVHRGGLYIYGSTKAIVEAGLKAIKHKVSSYKEVECAYQTITMIKPDGQLSAIAFTPQANYTAAKRYGSFFGRNSRFDDDIQDESNLTWMLYSDYTSREIDLLFAYFRVDELWNDYLDYGNVDEKLLDALRANLQYNANRDRWITLQSQH